MPPCGFAAGDGGIAIPIWQATLSTASFPFNVPALAIVASPSSHLQHIDDSGMFQPVTSNDLTMSFLEPFFPFDGSATRYLYFNVGDHQEAIRARRGCST